MNGAERERLVDSVLDRALGPQRVEPRAGFEERILANLPKEGERRPWWRWMWVPALAATALLAVVIGIRLMNPEPQAPVQVKKTNAVPNPEVATKPQVGIQPPVERRRQIATRGDRSASAPPVTIAKSEPPLPRQTVFPSPVPLTEQEQLLLAFVNRQRPQAELVAAEQQADRERIQKYFETGEVPEAKPIAAQPMR